MKESFSKTIQLVNTEDKQKRELIKNKFDSTFGEDVFVSNQDKLLVEILFGTSKKRLKTGTKEEYKSWAEEIIEYAGMEKEKTNVNLTEPNGHEKLVFGDFFNGMPYDILHDNLLLKNHPELSGSLPNYYENELAFFRANFPYKEQWKEKFIKEPTADENKKAEILAKNELRVNYINHKCSSLCYRNRKHPHQPKTTDDSSTFIDFSTKIETIVGVEDKYRWNYEVIGREFTVEFDGDDLAQVTPLKRRIVKQCHFPVDIKATDFQEMVGLAIKEGEEAGMVRYNIAMDCEAKFIAMKIFRDLKFQVGLLLSDFPRKVFFDNKKDNYHFTMEHATASLTNIHGNQVIKVIDLEVILNKLGAIKPINKIRKDLDVVEWIIDKKTVEQILGGE